MGKIEASVLLKLFIDGNEWCHATYTPKYNSHLHVVTNVTINWLHNYSLSPIYLQSAQTENFDTSLIIK